MRRREFITLLGGAAAAWPLAARTEQSGKQPVIGYLNSTSPHTYAAYTAAFLQGLAETGYVEGKNIAIHYRWAEGQNDRLQALANDLVNQQVAVIAATGATAGVFAAMRATRAIPIVFITGADPVKAGLVNSLNRPGANVTGFSFLANTLAAKQFELLRELVGPIALVGVLVNPANPALAEALLQDVQAAGHRFGLRLHVEHASTEREFSTAFKAFAQGGAGGIVIGADGFFTSRIELLAQLAIQYALPAICSYREFPKAGGLVSYGTSVTDGYRQVGIYTGKIISGEKPADLPVMQPVKFELVLNLKTAKALGLEIPTTLLALADEVIE
jgi:putative ABC transport system substrate-binding protein